jgi:hypothetical protein
MAGKMDRYQCSACHHPLIGTHSLPSPSPSSPSIFMCAWLVCGAHDRAKEPSHDGSVKTPHFSTGRSLFVLVPSASAPFLVPSSPLAQPATPPVSPRAQHTLWALQRLFICCLLAHTQIHRPAHGHLIAPSAYRPRLAALRRAVKKKRLTLLLAWRARCVCDVRCVRVR